MMPSNFLPAAFWGYWCQYIWINRYALIPSDLYERLLSLVRVKDYFVLTTNVDHSFQRSGFDKRNFSIRRETMACFRAAPQATQPGPGPMIIMRSSAEDCRKIHMHWRGYRRSTEQIFWVGYQILLGCLNTKTSHVNASYINKNKKYDALTRI